MYLRDGCKISLRCFSLSPIIADIVVTLCSCLANKINQSINQSVKHYFHSCSMRHCFKRSRASVRKPYCKCVFSLLHFHLPKFFHSPQLHLRSSFSPFFSSYSFPSFRSPLFSPFFVHFRTPSHFAFLRKTRNSSGDEIANVNFFYDDIVHAAQNRIDSCINYATDRRGYVLERRFAKFSEITQYNGLYAVQGHSRSPILVPIESSYTTSN